MKRAIALISLSLASTLVCAPLHAEKAVREISWSALKAEGRLAGGEIVPAGGGVAFESLRVTSPEGSPRTIPLFTIEQPGITGPRYALRGDVRGEGIEGQAYFEMWSFFAGGGRYFSRTLAQVGPMASLTGTFHFRPFVLPFFAEPGMRPEKLVVSIAFAGRGAVAMGPLRLVELEAGDDPLLPSGSWLTYRQISLIGGIGGAVLGTLGALIGVLASRGRARSVVLASLKGMLALGIACLAAAAFGWWSAQPWALLFMLLLIGVLCTALPAGLLGKVRQQYEEQEFRRMKALDAG